MNRQLKELLIAALISMLLLGATALIISSFAEGAENEPHLIRQHYGAFLSQLDMEEKEEDGSYSQLWRTIPHGAEQAYFIAMSSPHPAFGGVTGPRTRMGQVWRMECRNVFVAIESPHDMWGNIGKASVCTAFWRGAPGKAKVWNAPSEKVAASLQKEFDSNKGSSYSFDVYSPYMEVGASHWKVWGQQDTYKGANNGH